MLPVLSAVKSAYHYMKAKNHFEKREFGLALSQIDSAIAAVGPRASKANLFFYDILAADINIRISNDIVALKHIENAQTKIHKYSKLDHIDRAYLLDYCDQMKLETGLGQPASFRVSAENYDKVSRRYKREYPLRVA